MRLDVSYDGSGFRGFADQPGALTVAGELKRAISTVARHKVDLTCSGRTDAGVHAIAQVVHVDVSPQVDPARLVKSVNSILGPKIVLRDAKVVSKDFDARRSATLRAYRYLVHESAVPDPLIANVAWTVTGPLDLKAMASAADCLIGEHDFRAFCRRVPGTSVDDPIKRRVTLTSWSVVPPGAVDPQPGSRLLRFDIGAQSFCHQMVRSIVGLLVEVGRGRKRASDVHAALLGGDRSRSGDVAPPNGLCLVRVEFD